MYYLEQPELQLIHTGNTCNIYHMHISGGILRRMSHEAVLELGAMIFGSHRVANQSLGEPLRRILHSYESAALLKEISSNQPCMYCTIKEPTPTAPIKKKFKVSVNPV